MIRHRETWRKELGSGPLAEQAAILQRGERLGLFRAELDLGHISPGWRYLLGQGVPGILRTAEENMAATDDEEAKDFYASVIRMYSAFMTFMARLENQARKMALQHPEASDRMEKLASCLAALQKGAPSTLYEALQLYQVGNFAPSADNIRSFENGINWEHHKPGYHAVRTNTGCCATDSNWLRYILDGDYDEVGFLATSQRDGSGHVYNYILQDGWYYFIDLTHYHAQGSPINTSEESGDLSHYRATDFILGNIHN